MSIILLHLTYRIFCLRKIAPLILNGLIVKTPKFSYLSKAKEEKCRSPEQHNTFSSSKDYRYLKCLCIYIYTRIHTNTNGVIQL